MDGDNKALDIRIRQAMNYGFDRQNWSPICEIIWERGRQRNDTDGLA
jgi:hypothetical protein